METSQFIFLGPRGESPIRNPRIKVKMFPDRIQIKLVDKAIEAC